MAYLREIRRPLCAQCDKPATYELIGRRNNLYERYCKSHAQPMLRKLLADEAREAESATVAKP